VVKYYSKWVVNSKVLIGAAKWVAIRKGLRARSQKISFLFPKNLGFPICFQKDIYTWF
jgi:hypothetical protein